MALSWLIPKTRAQWIGAGVAVLLIVLFLKLFTGVFDGRAVEVSVSNAGDRPVFAYLDNTGRHGEGAAVTTVKTASGVELPSGILVPPDSNLSLGTAVGVFDAPTLHYYRVNADGLADPNSRNDCAFDTISWQKLEIPSRHVRLTVKDKSCVPLRWNAP